MSNIYKVWQVIPRRGGGAYKKEAGQALTLQKGGGKMGGGRDKKSARLAGRGAPPLCRCHRDGYGYDQQCR